VPIIREPDYDYNKKIKRLINSLISESKENYYAFRELMGEVFTISKIEGTEATKIPVSDHKIGMKFKQDMSMYT
jgi:hypothetical protein